MVGHKLKGLAGAFTKGFWQCHLSEVRCISILGGRAVELPGQFLASADAFVLEAAVSWPWMPLGQRRQVRVSLLDEVAVECPTDQVAGWRMTAFRARLPVRPDERNGGLRLEISEQNSHRLVGVLKLQLLDQSGTERLLLESLETTKPRLWVHSGSTCHLADVFASTSDFLVPEVTLRQNQLSAFVPPRQIELALSLAGGKQRVLLGTKLVQLNGQDVPLRWPAIPLNNPRLFPEPGPYSLITSLQGRDLATLHFRVAGEPECCQQVRVGRIQFQAETREGQTVRGLTTVSWEEHRAFQPIVTIQTAIPAPNSLANCSACTWQGSTLLWREDFLLPMDRVSRTVRLQRIELGGGGLHAQPKPVRLTVSIEIAGGQKGSATLVVLPAERIANFEGALKLNIEDLPFEESDYEHIIRSLGVARPASERWQFWRRLWPFRRERIPPSVED